MYILVIGITLDFQTDHRFEKVTDYRSFIMISFCQIGHTNNRFYPSAHEGVLSLPGWVAGTRKHLVNVITLLRLPVS